MTEILDRPVPEDAAVIVGAGLAGLFLALKMAPRRALVVAPTPLGAGSASAWAQGGLAAALAADDDPALHAADTIAAGAGLVDPVVARLIADDGPARVRDLIELGVPFDASPDGALRLSLEAAHSRPRVARVAGDLAGKAIMDAIAAAVRSAAHIDVVEGLRAVALLRGADGAAAGIICRDGNGGLVRLRARDVVLATGGIGGLWRVTTNPATALGGGLAMAARLGALIGDPEFVQFHPTAIDIGRDPAPLATEALRGEGARLVDRTGAPFMAAFDPRGDLAARDVVARAIASQIRAGAGAFLDCRAAVGAAFPDHFPTVFAACMGAGLDPRVAPIPVAPAAHYHMGGIVTDLWARTTVAGLSAVGECASTGAHGANRLASNSLLESVVFAKRCAERLREESGPAPDAGAGDAPPEISADARAELRALMQTHCGVERDGADRQDARDGVRALIARFGPANDLLAAAFVTEGAARRLESRGGHWAPDHPHAEDTPKRTFLTLRALELSVP